MPTLHDQLARLGDERAGALARAAAALDAGCELILAELNAGRDVDVKLCATRLGVTRATLYARVPGLARRPRATPGSDPT